MKELREKVVVITGAGGGIGLETAKAFARAGCRVAVCDRRAEAVATLRERLEACGGEALAMVADVGDEWQVRGFVTSVYDRWGHVDVLVNNAGYGVHKPFLKMSVEEIQGQMDTNYFGVVYATKAALEHMVPRRSGHIINIASVVAKIPVPNSGTYAATKAALDSMSLTLRAELSDYGIRVTTVYPGPTRTNFFETSGSPVNRESAFLQRPEKVADSVVAVSRRPRAEVYTRFWIRLFPVAQALLPGLVRLMLLWTARAYY